MQATVNLLERRLEPLESVCLNPLLLGYITYPSLARIWDHLTAKMLTNATRSLALRSLDFSLKHRGRLEQRKRLTSIAAAEGAEVLALISTESYG